MIKQIAYIGYPVKDMKRARAFYEEIFDLKPDVVMESENGAWTEYNIGTEGCFLLGKHDGWETSNKGPNAALEIDNFDDVVEKLKQKGIVFTMGPMEFPPCHMAIFEDTEGNSITIHKRKA